MTVEQNIKDRRKAKQMVKTILPNLKIYNQYVNRCRTFAQVLNCSNFGKSRIPIKKVELIHSDLFDRKYLVGFVNQSWLAKTAPGCNAIATPCLEIGELKSPPIVLVGSISILKRNSSLHSILEHEFVHVNQALNDDFPSNLTNPNANLTDQFIRYVFAEYQANFLQLETWPKLRPPKKYGLTLAEWCFLRGYTQALERLLLSAIEETFTEKKLFFTLNKIPKSLRKLLLMLDLETENTFNFIDRFKMFSFKALEIVAPIDNFAANQTHVYKELLKWIGSESKPLPK